MAGPETPTGRLLANMPRRQKARNPSSNNHPSSTDNQTTNNEATNGKDKRTDSIRIIMNTKTNDQIIRREIAARISGMGAEMQSLQAIQDGLLPMCQWVSKRIIELDKVIKSEIASAPPVQVKPSKHETKT